jgi:hypothetical protein
MHISVSMLISFLTPPLLHHLVQSTLYSLALDLQQLHTFQEQLVTVPLAGAFDLEDEMVAYPPQLDFILELRVP